MQAKKLLSQKFRSSLPNNIESLTALLQAIIDHPNETLVYYQQVTGLKRTTFFRCYEALLERNLIHKGPIVQGTLDYKFIPKPILDQKVYKFSGPATKMAFYLARFKPTHKAPNLNDWSVEEYGNVLGSYLGENDNELFKELIKQLHELLAIVAIASHDYTLFKNGPQVAELSPLPTDIVELLSIFEK